MTAWHVLEAIGALTNGTRVGVDPLRGGEAFSAVVVDVNPVCDLAVLSCDGCPLTVTRTLTATDRMRPRTEVTVTGHAEPDDPGHTYRFLDAPGQWAGGTTRDNVRLGRMTSVGVVRGMSGAPVIRDRDGAVAGVVSGRYNSGDGWLAGTVWVARTEDVAALLDGITDVTLGQGGWAWFPDAGNETAYWATVREIRDRTGVLADRQDELAEIAAFAGGGEGYRWVAGEPWAGKTSLLAEAAMSLSAEVDVVCYFLSRREADADSSRFLAAVVPQLSALTGEDPPVADVRQFRALWQQAASRAEAQGRHLLLIVDGLDEDMRPPGLPGIAALLPAGAGGRSHVLVSSRLHPEILDGVPPGHPVLQVQPTPLEAFAGARELARLARQEIDDLLRDDSEDGLAADLLGFLAAAGGPLTVPDLAALTGDGAAGPAARARRRRIRKLVAASAARSVQPVGRDMDARYRFAHESLLAYAQDHPDLNDPSFRHRIHQWAEQWRAAGWPAPADEQGTPRYLLDIYPATLARESARLARLAGDIGWVEAAIASAGVDTALTAIRQAAAASPDSGPVAAVLAAVTGQAYGLRPLRPLDQPGYILRQLWMQACGLGDDSLAADILDRLQARPGQLLLPAWTTRLASRALADELGHYDGQVRAVAVLADGRVVTGGAGGRVRIWEPFSPGAASVELGRHDHWVNGMAVLADGRIVTVGGRDERALIWDPSRIGAAPVELGRHSGGMHTVAVLPDGRVVTGANDGRVLMWDPSLPGAVPVELGRHSGRVEAVAVLPDGHVVTGGSGIGNGILVWDPAAPGTALGEVSHDRCSPSGLAVLADGRVVTTNGPWSHQVLIWDPAAREGGVVELGRHPGRGVCAVAVLSDGRVVTGGYDCRVLIWDPCSPGAAPLELGRHDSAVYAVAVLPDGRVVTSGHDRRVLVWDPAVQVSGPTGLAHTHGGRGREAGGGRVVMTTLPDGHVVTGEDDGQILMWDRSAGDPVRLGRHSRDIKVTAVMALADGRIVSCAGDGPGQLLAWDPATPGHASTEIGQHYGYGAVTAIAEMADGRVVTSTTGGHLLAWGTAAPCRAPSELRYYNGYPKGQTVLVGGQVMNIMGSEPGVPGQRDRQFLAWDMSAPRNAPTELCRYSGVPEGLAVLADGRVVTSGSGGRVLMWDPATPMRGPVQLGRDHSWVHAVVALPDGRVVTGANNGRVLAWDPDAPGQGPAELGRHDGEVVAMAALSDGRVVTGADNGQVLVWDEGGTGTQVAQLSCPVIGLAVAPQGQSRSSLAIAHPGGGITMWSYVK